MNSNAVVSRARPSSIHSSYVDIRGVSNDRALVTISVKTRAQTRTNVTIASRFVLFGQGLKYRS